MTGVNLSQIENIYKRVLTLPVKYDLCSFTNLNKYKILFYIILLL